MTDIWGSPGCSLTPGPSSFATQPVNPPARTFASWHVHLQDRVFPRTRSRRARWRRTPRLVTLPTRQTYLSLARRMLLSFGHLIFWGNSSANLSRKNLVFCFLAGPCLLRLVLANGVSFIAIETRVWRLDVHLCFLFGFANEHKSPLFRVLRFSFSRNKHRPAHQSLVTGSLKLP